MKHRYITLEDFNVDENESGFYMYGNDCDGKGCIKIDLLKSRCEMPRPIKSIVELMINTLVKYDKLKPKRFYKESNPYIRLVLSVDFTGDNDVHCDMSIQIQIAESLKDYRDCQWIICSEIPMDPKFDFYRMVLDLYFSEIRMMFPYEPIQ